ncbi:MAG TPA: hypothetical protein V6C76_13850 [Drouetiella sp.]
MALPDLHFWTASDGKAQLDSRITDNSRGILSFYGPDEPNVYGGGFNNGVWRGFSAIGGSRKWYSFVNNGLIENYGPSLLPAVNAVEQQVMEDNDRQAMRGISPVGGIALEGSGIRWGTGKHQSYLKGPIRFTCNSIRFDGPISQIGTDVTLNVRYIIVDGYRLPSNAWRQALTQIVQAANQPNPAAQQPSVLAPNPEPSTSSISQQR